MKNLILILFVCLGIQCTHSQASSLTPEEIIASFFKTYANNEPVKALENLYKHAPWYKEDNKGIQDLKTKFNTLREREGEYHGYELLNVKKVKDTFVIYTYLVKHENVPLIFTFQFYKPNKVWGLYSFSFDYNFVTELEQSIEKELFNEN